MGATLDTLSRKRNIVFGASHPMMTQPQPRADERKTAMWGDDPGAHDGEDHHHDGGETALTPLERTRRAT